MTEKTSAFQKHERLRRLRRRVEQTYSNINYYLISTPPSPAQITYNVAIRLACIDGAPSNWREYWSLACDIAMSLKPEDPYFVPVHLRGINGWRAVIPSSDRWDFTYNNPEKMAEVERTFNIRPVCPEARANILTSTFMTEFSFFRSSAFTHLSNFTEAELPPTLKHLARAVPIRSKGD